MVVIGLIAGAASRSDELRGEYLREFRFRSRDLSKTIAHEEQVEDYIVGILQVIFFVGVLAGIAVLVKALL